jgi:hypothetical protein
MCKIRLLVIGLAVRELGSLVAPVGEAWKLDLSHSLAS